MRRRGADARSDARPGYVLTCQGADLGVIERVDGDRRDGTATLRVRGGISGCLEYVVPESAVVSVRADLHRAELRPDLVFDAEQVGDDGRVLLVARRVASESP